MGAKRKRKSKRQTKTARYLISFEVEVEILAEANENDFTLDVEQAATAMVDETGIPYEIGEVSIVDRVAFAAEFLPEES